MQSWPLGLKLGVGVVVVLAVVLLWVGIRRVPYTAAPESVRTAELGIQHPEPFGQQPSEGTRPQGQRAAGGPELRPKALPQGQLAPPRPATPGIEMPPAGIQPFQAREPGDTDVPEEEEDEEDFESLRQVALSDPDPDERMEALLLLGTLDDPRVIPVLAEAVRDPDPDVRLTAVETLGDFEGLEPIEALKEALRDPNPDVRFEALGLLADIGGAAARQAIEGAVNDEDEDVRGLAQEILEMEDF